MIDPHDEIVRLEQAIEALRAQEEGARKLALVARGVILAGGATLALLLAGALGRSPAALVFGLSALLGGVALYGSNQSTRQAIAASIRAHEARRAALIEASDLRTVPT